MKQTQLLTVLCLTAGVFTLSACGGGDKPADAPKPAADASKPADTAPPPMIDTIKKSKTPVRWSWATVNLRFHTPIWLMASLSVTRWMSAPQLSLS